MIAFIN